MATLKCIFFWKKNSITELKIVSNHKYMSCINFFDSFAYYFLCFFYKNDIKFNHVSWFKYMYHFNFLLYWSRELKTFCCWNPDIFATFYLLKILFLTVLYSRPGKNIYIYIYMLFFPVLLRMWPLCDICFKTWINSTGFNSIEFFDISYQHISD